MNDDLPWYPDVLWQQDGVASALFEEAKQLVDCGDAGINAMLELDPPGE